MLLHHGQKELYVSCCLCQKMATSHKSVTDWCSVVRVPVFVRVGRKLFPDIIKP